MPVTYSARTGKWCMGKRCTYSSKAQALSAYRAYLAKKGSYSTYMPQGGKKYG